MRIAYIVTALEDVSSIHIALDIVKLMVNHGHDCKVFYFRENKELDFPCETEKISFLKKVIFSDYDVIHVHCFRPTLYIWLWKSLSFSTKKVLFVNTIHSYLFPDYMNSMGRIKGFFVAMIEIFLMKRIDYNICLTKEAINYYSKFINRKKLVRCHNAKIINCNLTIPESDEYEIEKFRTENKIVCGSICVVSDIKGLEQVIYSLQYNPQVGYLIIGDGVSARKLKKIAVEIGVKDRVLFLGFRKNAYRYLPYIDVFCMPSRSEGFGVSMLEAAIYTKPIVTTDIPIFNELFDSTESVKFPLDNIEQCAKAIIKAYDNKEYYGTNAKKRFDLCYSLDKFYSRHLEIYTMNKI